MLLLFTSVCHNLNKPLFVEHFACSHSQDHLKPFPMSEALQELYAAHKTHEVANYSQSSQSPARIYPLYQNLCQPKTKSQPL